MKKLIIIIISFLCFSALAQSGKDKSDTNSVEDKNKQIQLLNLELDNYKKENVSLKEELRKNILAAQELRGVVKGINDLILENLYVKKYKNDPKYFLQTALEDEDTLTIKKYNALLKSIKITSNEDDKMISDKALIFNENYLVLSKTKKTLSEKFDKKNVEKMIFEINQLKPIIDRESKLNVNKTKNLQLLINYEKISSEIIPAEIKKIQQNTVELDNNKRKFKELKANVEYIKYSYILNVLAKFEKNPLLKVNDYFDVKQETSIPATEKVKSSEVETKKEGKDLQKTNIDEIENNKSIKGENVVPTVDKVEPKKT